MADWLKIHDLIVECHIGVFEWERKALQKIWIDIEIPLRTQDAARADELKKTVDYGSVVTAVRNHVQHKTYQLMETMAEEVAGVVVGQFHPSQVSVRIKKRSLPGIGEAVVEIVRGGK